jgi:glycosyltransferase involved in cell wall biosynthesis
MKPIAIDVNLESYDSPLITVVTVVFNGEKYIERTIRSIIGQTYPNIEYVIIDGGSTDGTINIIKKYDASIDYWISESDFGIYDAMNKALKIASGEWINFMNAGDVFFASNTLDLVFAADAEMGEEVIIYGDVNIIYPDFTRIEKAGNIKLLWAGMKFCHQSVFVKTNYHKLNLFNSSNRIAADLEFFYFAFKCNADFKYVNETISSVQTGGLSESNRIKTILASRDAVLKSTGFLGLYLIYYIFCLSAVVRYIFKAVLPRGLSEFIIKMKR